MVNGVIGSQSTLRPVSNSIGRRSGTCHPRPFLDRFQGIDLAPEISRTAAVINDDLLPAPGSRFPGDRRCTLLRRGLAKAFRPASNGADRRSPRSGSSRPPVPA
jgi:hypothetical protein